MMPGAEALALGLKYAVGGSALFAEVLIAACLFAHGQPTRQHPIARAVAAVGLLFATELLTSFLAGTRSTDDGSLVVLNIDASYPLSLGIIGGLVTCTAFLLVTIPTLLACFEMSPWAATFCATAGYALQNLASSIGETVGLILSAAGIPGIVTGGNAWLTAISCTAVYAIAYLLFIRHIDPKGLEGRGNPAMLAMVVVVVFGIIEFDLILKYVVTGSLALPVTLCMRAFHALICVFVIIAEVELVVVRQLSSEKAAAERLLAEQERQYQLSRENIEAINVKCHDIRHQIRHLADGGTSVTQQALDELSSEIDVYDSLVKTGNDALDTILSEKGLICERRGIPFRCIADGTAVSFMQLVDIYALFGNAVENAIEASERLPQDQRDISLMVRKAAGTASIHVENRFAGNVSFGPDGLPRTTKADSQSHGFGTRSIRLIAERYGGSVAMRAKDGVFHLNVVIPLPE